MFITVPNPITDGAITQIKTKIQRAIEREGRQVRKIVFDFNPKGAPAATGEYGPCITLKNYLLDLRLGQVSARYPPLLTVALVRGEAGKHTVLPVTACAEMVMSPEARIGDVLRGHEGRVAEEVRTAYQALADRSAAGELILKMLDPGLVLYKVKTPDGVHYWDEARIKARKDTGAVVTVEPEILPGLGVGNTSFDAKLARAYGLCKGIYATREEVADAYGLSRQSLNEDWLVGRTPVPFRVELTGALDESKLGSLKRRIADAVRRDANVIILCLDCDGGQTVDVASYARYLHELTDVSGVLPVKTIAWVPPNRSLGAATFLALGCSEIVMGSGASLGDFDYLKGRSDEDLRAPREMLVQLARQQGYEPLLFEATLNRDRVLYAVRSARNAGVHRLLTEKQLQEDALSAEPQWVVDRRIPTRPGEFLKVDAPLAREWGVALPGDVNTVADLQARYKDYNLEKMRNVPDDWLDRVAEFFREPAVKILLILVGIACMILALKVPGLGFPEVIAGVCFVLFFWAHSFVGQYTMLAVLLFVLGLILLGLEVFVTPGLGVTGISGILLLVVSLVLVTLEKMPESTQDWVNLGNTLTTFALTLVAAVGVAFTAAWYLPSIPYANRLLLQPPADDGEGGDSAPGLQAPASLLGAIGEAATPLRPAGKVRFGDDFLDVVSEGDYVNPGSRVQVIEIEGNRIVVKEV